MIDHGRQTVNLDFSPGFPMMARRAPLQPVFFWADASTSTLETTLRRVIIASRFLRFGASTRACLQFPVPFNVAEKRSRATSAFADCLSTSTNQRPPITPSQEVVA